jgi:NAD(P)-dependent dehydrogenase (short-subunit alcohol dehydrogenase family)
MNAPRVILITGVSKGLGRALLEQFSQRGHAVYGCARSENEIRLLQQHFPAPHRFATLSVADDRQVDQWAAELLAQNPPPELLINNAAIINANNPLWKVGAEEFGAVIDVNLKGVANVIRAFVPAMIRNGRGIIVNFSSGWGRSTDADVAPYCATKWGIEGLTQALAQELPGGLAAIPVNPGVINTAMLQSCFGSSASAFPSPKQWAQRAVPFLLGLSIRDNGRPLTVPGMQD